MSTEMTINTDDLRKMVDAWQKEADEDFGLLSPGIYQFNQLREAFLEIDQLRKELEEAKINVDEQGQIIAHLDKQLEDIQESIHCSVYCDPANQTLRPLLEEYRKSEADLRKQVEDQRGEIAELAAIVGAQDLGNTIEYQAMKKQVEDLKKENALWFRGLLERTGVAGDVTPEEVFAALDERLQEHICEIENAERAKQRAYEREDELQVKIRAADELDKTFKLIASALQDAHASCKCFNGCGRCINIAKAQKMCEEAIAAYRAQTMMQEIHGGGE